ncbi:MAG: hypothetical protein Q4Q22_03330 [Methanosphaera sp.]|nr:hypothetical protein [Methanosphaera sp.]
MVQSVIVYSEIIPTILSLVGIYLIINGVLGDKRELSVAGVVVFLLAVIIPFVILTNII